MFTVEIKVNERTVYSVYGHNEGQVRPGEFEYYWEFKDHERGSVLRGHLLHRRREGLAELVCKVLKAGGRPELADWKNPVGTG